MINQNFQNTPFVDGCPTVSNVSKDDLDNDRDCGPITVTTTFINYLNSNISVVMRNGLRHTVPLVHNRNKKVFIIREKYQIRSESFDELLNLFSVCSDINLPDLSALEAGFNETMRFNKFGTACVTVDTVIDLKSLERGKGSVYIPNRDLVISRSSLLDAVSHPFATNTILIDKYKALVDNSKGASFYIEIVDNEAQISDRFFYIDKTLFEIKPIKDPSRSSGVYFCSVTADIIGNPQINKVIYSIEEAQDRLGLYKTREEALSSGNTEASRKETIQRLTHEISLNNLKHTAEQNELKTKSEELKAEYTNLEIENKKYILALETKLRGIEQVNKEAEYEYKQKNILLANKLEKEKAKREKRKLDTSDYYEHRSHVRKDSSEMVKIIPSMVMGVIAIMALAAKFS